MIKLTNITTDASQTFTLQGEDGQTVDMSLRFLPRMGQWIMDVVADGIDLTSATLVMGPNILRAYRNNISFGLMCVSTDGFDPTYLDDFTSGRITLYLLNSSEVSVIEGGYFS